MDLQNTCAECGDTFTPAKAAQSFCCAAHRQSFHHRNAVRGQAAIPLLQVMRTSKNGRTELTAYAWRELCALGDIWNAEDRKAGRTPAIPVEAKMDAGWRAVDLER